MASSLVAVHLVSGLSAAPVEKSSFELAEERWLKAKTYLRETDQKIKDYDAMTPGVAASLMKQWTNNWRLYDKKRASQGVEADLLNERLRDLRRHIGLTMIVAAFADQQIKSAKLAQEILKREDSWAPNDKQDTGREVRKAKKNAIKYRLSLASEQQRNAKAQLDQLAQNYQSALAKLRTKVRPISVFHPKWDEMVKAQGKLKNAIAASAIAKTDMTFAGEKAIAAERVNDANYDYLVELLNSGPVQLDKIDVHFDDKPWYVVELKDSKAVEVAKGEIPPDIRMKAYKDVLKRLDEDMLSLEFQIDDGTKLVNELGTKWRKEANISFDLDNSIAQLKVNAQWVNLGVEMSFMAIGILASGGLSAVQYAPNVVESVATSLSKKVVTTPNYVDPLTKAARAAIGGAVSQAPKAVRELSSRVLEASARAMNDPYVKLSSDAIKRFYRFKQEQFQAAVRRTAKEVYFVSLPAKNIASGLGDNEYFLGDYIELSGAQGIVVADVLESVITNGGFDDARYAAQLGRAVATNQLSALSAEQVKGMNAAGLAIASTTVKVANQMITDLLVEDWQKDAIVAGAKAGVFKAEYFKILNVRNAMQDELAAKKTFKKSVEKLLAQGPQAREYKVLADNAFSREEFDQFGHYQIKLRFSRPLLWPPVLKAEGMGFSAGKAENLPHREWVFYVDHAQLPEDTRQVKLSIELDRREPYGLLDSNTKTPPQLVRIERNGWTGYEPGASNHILRIRPDDEKPQSVKAPKTGPAPEGAIVITEIFIMPQEILEKAPANCSHSNAKPEDCFVLRGTGQFWVDFNGKSAKFASYEKARAFVKELTRKYVYVSTDNGKVVMLRKEAEARRKAFEDRQDAYHQGLKNQLIDHMKDVQGQVRSSSSIAKELFGNNGSSNGLPQLPDLQDALPAPDAIEPTLPNVDGGINLMPDLQPLNEKPIGEGLN
jgi:hypothetical protein